MFSENTVLETWRGDRVAEGAALEMLCTSQGYRGFESRPLRHFLVKPILLNRLFVFCRSRQMSFKTI